MNKILAIKVESPEFRGGNPVNGGSEGFPRVSRIGGSKISRLIRMFSGEKGMSPISSAETHDETSPGLNLLQVPSVSRQAMVSSDRLDQFEDFLNQYKKEEVSIKKTEVFKTMTLFLKEAYPSLFQEKTGLSSQGLRELSSSAFTTDKQFFYQFVELLLDQFIKNGQNIEFVQMIWKDDLFLAGLLDFEHRVSQDPQNTSSNAEKEPHSQLLFESLRGIKAALLVLGLTPFFSFEKLGIPDLIGIGPYTGPATDLHNKKFTTDLKKSILETCDLESFQLIHLRNELGTLDSEMMLKEFHDAFLTHHISTFLQSILSSDKKESLNQLFLNFTAPLNIISSQEVYKKFKGALPTFLDHFFEETHPDARLQFMYKEKPLGFMAHFLIEAFKNDYFKENACKVWDKILDKAQAAIPHLDDLDSYTQDKDTLNYFLALAGAFLAEKSLCFDHVSERLKTNIQKFSLQDASTDMSLEAKLHLYLNSLKLQIPFSFKDFLKQSILNVAEPSLSPGASKALILNQFKDCLTGLDKKFAPLLSTMPLYALIPFFVKGFVDALAQDHEYSEYLINRLTDMIQTSSSEENCQSVSSRFYRNESVQILEALSKKGLPDLQGVLSTELMALYSDIKEKLKSLTSQPSLSA